MLLTISSAIVTIIGCIVLLAVAVGLILRLFNKDLNFPEDRIEQKVDDIRNVVCMLADLILEQTPEGQRFLEKHPDYFENSEADEGSDNNSKEK